MLIYGKKFEVDEEELEGLLKNVSANTIFHELGVLIKIIGRVLKRAKNFTGGTADNVTLFVPRSNSRKIPFAAFCLTFFA